MGILGSSLNNQCNGKFFFMRYFSKKIETFLNHMTVYEAEDNLHKDCSQFWMNPSKKPTNITDLENQVFKLPK